jgi:hypothetical protein
MDTVGAANASNGGNIIPILTHELHDTSNDYPNIFRFSPLKKGLPCTQASHQNRN